MDMMLMVMGLSTLMNVLLQVFCKKWATKQTGEMNFSMRVLAVTQVVAESPTASALI